MDEQRVERIANADATRLGVVDDGLSHLQVALLVEVRVYHTGSCLDDWHTGCVANKVDEFSATARNA